MSDFQDRLKAAFPIHAQIGNALIINADCMEVMKHLRNGDFELSCVDPPYGLGESLVAGGTWSVKYQTKGAAWDISPGREYFDELRRVSHNQIIWGGNYFSEFIKAARCCIAWVKPNMSGMHTMSDFELALTSFDRNSRVINLSSQSKDQRIHVTQKPVKLYEFLLTNYAKTGDRILDTHGGSMSSVIACNNMGFEIVCCEMDPDYFSAACERVEDAFRQQRMFS
ncbi:MAG: site-specific DNA-methyltransferase [Pseudomonadota bacterium]|nr:site-specific DNA-methyltransferase [Pseudomonadota bacterium]